MPNLRGRVVGGAMPADLPTMTEIAAAVLRRSAHRLDQLRRDVERDLDRHINSRARVEALIERLIDRLDTLDGGDDDEPTMGDVPEGYFDEAEFVSEDEGVVTDDELTSCENAGRGFTLGGGATHDDAEDDDPGGDEHDGREPDGGH